VIKAAEQEFIGARWDEDYSFFISGMALLEDIAPVSVRRGLPLRGITT
jgi:hypothetical protein